MTGPPASRPGGGGNSAAVSWTVLFVGALVLVPIVIGVYVVRTTFGGDDAPSCESAPVTLEWSESDLGWRWTGPFTLDVAQTVQVDVRLFDPDGGVIQLGSTVYAVPAGEPFPEFGETATTTTPFRGLRVGHGREAVNEQVRLDAGSWELMLRGVPGTGDACPRPTRSRHARLMGMRTVTTWVALAGVMLASCGGGDDGSSSPAPSTTPALTPSTTLDIGDAVTAPTALVDLDSIDLEELDPSDVAFEREDEDFDVSGMDDIAARTTRLTDEFGIDGAFDALMLALARGYEISAIETGIDDGRLRVDGTIERQTPTLPAGELLDLPPVVQGFRRPALPVDQLSIDELRAAARTFDRVAERLTAAWDAPEIATPEGVAVLHAVQALARLGLSGDQIINAIVLGYGGIEKRIVQIGFGRAAVCRLVVIGGKAEAVAFDSGCDRYAEYDARLRAAFAERGFEYPACDVTSIEGVYDACAGRPSTAQPASATTLPDPEALEPASWEGTIEFDENAGKLVESYIAIERLADGTYTLDAFIEFTRESIGCFWTELQTANGTGAPTTDSSRIEFDGEFTSDIEPSGDGCAGGSERFATTFSVDIDGDALSGSVFAYTTFRIAR